MIVSTLSLSSDCICPCGRLYNNNKFGWYRRHIAFCSIYLSSQHNTLGLASPSVIEAETSAILDERIELESFEEFEDFDREVDLQEVINLEITLENEENTFDADFVSDILNED